MPLVVGIEFSPVTKVYYFDPNGHDDLQSGDRVIVDTARGRTLGFVVFPPREVPAGEISGTLKPVVRRATAWDMVQSDQMAHKEAEAQDTCQERANTLGLPMKVVKAEYNYDGGAVVVYFTSEQRVDFRNLVHDLAQALRTRVEMRQVGVRDQAKFIGGYGRCGRQLCCATWLREFTPVSIKMAKQQDLPLNSSEVSGVCGRLLCCLSYENGFYGEARRQMPRVNSILETPQGPGKVKQVHVLRNSVTVQVEGPNETFIYVEVPVPEPLAEGRAAGAGCEGCPAPSRRQLTSSEEEPHGPEDELTMEESQPDGNSSPARLRPERGPDSHRQAKAKQPPVQDIEPGLATPDRAPHGRSRRRRR